MSINNTDPRVFFAAERTLLAWLRTGLAIMGLGFVVARFGLFLRLLAAQSHDTPAPAHHYASSVPGIAFVLTGTLAIALSALQHRRFVATLASADLPPAYSRVFAPALSLLVAGLGAALAVYLMLAPHWNPCPIRSTAAVCAKMNATDKPNLPFGGASGNHTTVCQSYQDRHGESPERAPRLASESPAWPGT